MLENYKNWYRVALQTYVYVSNGYLRAILQTRNHFICFIRSLVKSTTVCM